MGLTGWRPSLCGSSISSQLISVFVCSTFLLPALLLHCATFQSSHRYFSVVFVCLNICAHPQDPLLSLSSEVTQLSLTWQKCLAHPWSRVGWLGGCQWLLLLDPWHFSLFSVWCVGRQNQTTCNTSALGKALINDGQVKREWRERNFWGYWRSVALISFLHLSLFFHLYLERQENRQRYCTVLCHFLNLYSDMTSMIKHTKNPHS